jgi:hypothetical protein
MDRITGGIVVGAAIIAAAIYFRPLPPQPLYQLHSSPNAVARLNTTTGEVVVCSGGQCIVMTKGGSDDLFVLDRPD